jgi:MUN domain
LHSRSQFCSLKPCISQSVRELGERLFNIKGNGPQAKVGSTEADEVLRPLMDLLDGSLTMYAQSCEKTVLKRLLKELWKIVIRTIEKTIVLPPINDKTVSSNLNGPERGSSRSFLILLGRLSSKISRTTPRILLQTPKSKTWVDFLKLTFPPSKMLKARLLA